MNRDQAKQEIAEIAAKEAADLIDLYDVEPDRYPEGRTADTAFKNAMRQARRCYARGKCALCKGPAIACARRHAQGSSCT